MNRITRACVMVALAFAVAGCGDILPKPAPPPQLYRLTPADGPFAAGPAVAAQLLVDPPAAAAAIDTQRVALSHGATTIDYFADAAWVDRAPAMVQALLVESLENAGRIQAVARNSLALRADAILMPELRHFEAVYSGAGPPEIRVQIDCHLVKLPQRSIIATRSFAATVTAKQNDVPAIIDGFNTATHETLRQLADWVAATLPAAVQ